MLIFRKKPVQEMQQSSGSFAYPFCVFPMTCGRNAAHTIVRNEANTFSFDAFTKLSKIICKGNFAQIEDISTPPDVEFNQVLLL